MTGEQSGKVKSRTFYHHIDRVCMTSRERDYATVRRRQGGRGEIWLTAVFHV